MRIFFKKNDGEKINSKSYEKLKICSSNILQTWDMI
jgi:hypothetical protein